MPDALGAFAGGNLIAGIIAIILAIIIFIKPNTLAYIVAALLLIGGIISVIASIGLISLGV